MRLVDTTTERGGALLLAGRVALVTGAAKGLGSAISEVLAADGAGLTLVGRDEEALGEHAANLDEKHPGRQSHVAVCDVTDEAQVERAVAETVRRFGGLDVVVNAAGTTGPIETPAQDVKPDEFRFVLEVNLVGRSWCAGRRFPT